MAVGLGMTSASIVLGWFGLIAAGDAFMFAAGAITALFMQYAGTIRFS